MAKTRRTKATKKIKNNSQTADNKTGFLSRINFKLTESYTSLILGAVVVLFIGILILTFTSISKNRQTSSAKTTPSAEQSDLTKATSSTYTVRPGDDLWTISERFYNDGFRWTEIAKANKLENPGLIYAGNKLNLPKEIAKEKANATTAITQQGSGKIIARSAIAEDTYVVQTGDDLWNIAVRAYGDGYRWTEIAKANNLANPDMIHTGNVFKIPR